MPKVNVNAFGVVNLKFATSAFNSTTFSIINRQYSMACASFLKIRTPCIWTFYFAVDVMTFYETINFDSSYHFSLMKEPDSRSIQRQSDFEPGNCLRGLVSLGKERETIQPALKCSTKIEFSWYDLTSGRSSFFRLTLARVLHGSKSDCRWIDRVFKDINCYDSSVNAYVTFLVVHRLTCKPFPLRYSLTALILKMR